jgi:hypothetical protein
MFIKKSLLAVGLSGTVAFIAALISVKYDDV